jgi:hypothetical protein
MRTWPARAEQLLAQIIDTAPADSEIHRAARERIQTLRASCDTGTVNQ